MGEFLGVESGQETMERLAEKLRLQDPEDVEMMSVRDAVGRHLLPIIPGDQVRLNTRGRLECRTCKSELDPTMVVLTKEEPMEAGERKTRIDHVLVKLGDDGLGYVTTVYANGEKGHRSEGYGSEGNTPEENLAMAEEYARDDFEGLGIPVEVVR